MAIAQAQDPFFKNMLAFAKTHLSEMQVLVSMCGTNASAPQSNKKIIIASRL